MSSVASRFIAGALAGSTSKPAISIGEAPRPKPNSSRPRLIWSSITTSSATRSGWYIGVT
jgi:hypothetical protein